MYDSPKLIGLRNELIKNLLKKGIKNKDILKAFLKVPRHLFIHKDFESYAYKDEAFPIEITKQFHNHSLLHFKLNFSIFVKVIKS